MAEFPILPPHEAGAKIRVLAKELVEALNKTPKQGQGHFVSTHHTESAWNQVGAAQVALEQAMATRRKSAMVPALYDYKMAVRRFRDYTYSAATDQIANKTATWQLLKNGTTPMQAAEQIRGLANNLPTQDDLPSTDSRDTALRAIIAVLRTHSFPGTENLTHQAKEDPSGKTQQAVGDEAAGGQAASQSVSGHGLSGIVIDEAADILKPGQAV